MCDFDCANLIDLTLEDDVPCLSNNTEIKTEIVTQPSGDGAAALEPLFISPTWRKRDSLDNNPFDHAQKMANRQYDPFDIVEREASLKARIVDMPPAAEVKLGNLLSLSDDNLLDDKTTVLDFESPPILLDHKLTSDSGSDTNANSSTELSASSKHNKAMEYRKRLLKLSLSNATLNSPVARKQSSNSEDVFGTPVSSMFSRAAEFGEDLIASESPLKLVEDDLMSEEPANISDSEKNFEADLEMLKIPILNELPSPILEQSPNLQKNDADLNKTPTVSKSTTLSNLEAIKAKLKAKREETNNNHQLEISSLIENLKSLISSGEMPNDIKKQQASDLLESLSNALSTTISDETIKPQGFLTVPSQPQPIKRQGTFDIELQENEDQIDNEPQPLVQEMPNCMTSSSATYDGETAEEKQDLNLPEIAPVSPHVSHEHQHPHLHLHSSQDYQQPDVNDIMEQLSKLLINNSNSDSHHHSNSNNPTFIVVMNSNQLSHSSNNSNNFHLNIPSAKQRSAMVASYMENSFNDGSPDLTRGNPPLTRRRSQSLSIHDKVKIVQLPLQPPTPRSIQKQQNVQLDESPPISTPPSCDMVTPEFKTPSRMIRRNSYSSGTPYTAQVGVRRTGFGSDGKNSPHVRRAQTLDTHHERQHQMPQQQPQQQQQAIVRPMSLKPNNMPTFKPDLKKKHKHNTESIMKSTGPLKATIPVKKVAPMIKTAPPTPDHKAALQSLPKPSKMPLTPVPKGKSVVAAGYPNACSTPAAALAATTGFTSPLKRTGGPLNKPRYSYLSKTPNPKPVSASALAAGLKRRTITEFKAKSPLKPRVSSVGLTAAAASSSSKSRISTGTTRLSVSAGARISKTPSKPTSNTATVRPTNRLGSRISAGGSALTKNKENKRP